MASSRGAGAAGPTCTPREHRRADIDAVIDIFSAHRLLVLGQNSVEIAHDVLLQAWKQLRDWLGDDQLDRALYSQVVTDAATWESNRRDSSYLYRPGRLAAIDAAVTRWQDAPTRYPPLPGHQQGVPWRRSPRRAPQRPAAARRLRDPGPADRPGGGGIGRRLVSAGGRGPAT